MRPYPAMNRLLLAIALACATVALLPAAPAGARHRRVAPAARVHAQPARARGTPQGRPGGIARPVLQRNPARTRARKAAAIRRYRRTLRRTRGRKAPLTPRRAKATVFSGINAPGISDTGSSPSDSTGAIGPAQYLEIVNGRISVYDRSSMVPAVSTADQDAFMGTPSGASGDPQIQWDPQSNRWYYLAYDAPPRLRRRFTSPSGGRRPPTRPI